MSDAATVARRIWRALRLAVESIGWMGLLTAVLGGAHFTASGKSVDWSLFYSGAMWIGVPLAFFIATILQQEQSK